MYSHFGPVDLRASTNSQRTFKHFYCQRLIREWTASNILVYNVLYHNLPYTMNNIDKMLL